MKALAISLIVLAAGCARDFEKPRTFLCPEPENFQTVSFVIEKRCGSLDCHGNLARPMRITGSTGLRLYTPDQFADPIEAENDGVGPGGTEATTAAELEANREAICGIEPERTEQVVLGNLDPTDLMVIRKPTLRERHKGGAVFFKGGAGESCVASWLTGAVILPDCIEAIQAP
jgi:hypothetical protein